MREGLRNERQLEHRGGRRAHLLPVLLHTTLVSLVAGSLPPREVKGRGGK